MQINTINSCVSASTRSSYRPTAIGILCALYPSKNYEYIIDNRNKKPRANWVHMRFFCYFQLQDFEIFSTTLSISDKSNSTTCIVDP